MDDISPVLVLFAHLLLRSGMINNDLLAVALERSKQTGLGFGWVVLQEGLVSDRDWKAAVLAQRLVRESLISFPLAVAALSQVHKNGMDFARALAHCAWLADGPPQK